MQITEVRVKLMESSEDRLRGFCSITFDDCFVVRDLKIIEGNNGPFVAMPSRKLTSNCGRCRSKNHLKAKFCNQCGAKLRQDLVEFDHAGRAKLYADIAHPVNAKCREMIQRSVIEALDKEVELAKQPGYRPRYDDNYESQYDYEDELTVREPSKKTSKDRVDSAHSKQNPKHEAPDLSDAPTENENDKPNSGDGFGQGVFDE